MCPNFDHRLKEILRILTKPLSKINNLLNLNLESCYINNDTVHSTYNRYTNIQSSYDLIVYLKKTFLGNEIIDLTEIKNLDYDKRIVDFESEFADVYNDIIDFGDFVKNMHRIPIAAIKDLVGIIHFKIKGKKENISQFIYDLSKELINKISEKEFEDKIRKIIKDTLDNNMVKSIYYKILNFIIDIFNKIKKYIKKSN